MGFRFGPFQLDPRTGILSGPEGPIPLRRQAFRLAEVLLEHAPELLAHNTLLDEVWGRTALSANALPQTISELRHALGDDAHHPRFIETVHRRGYRMICPVDHVAPQPRSWSQIGTGMRSPGPRRPDALPSRLPGGLPGTGILLVVVALLVASSPSPGTDALPAWPVVELGQQPSLAVLDMCARLPGGPVHEADSAHPHFPDLLERVPVAVAPALMTTCLPAR